MSKLGQKQRDKEVTRQIIKLFWKSFFVQKWSLFLTYIVRSVAFVLTNVVLPLYVSFGIQAIITRNFSAVNHYAIILFLLSLVVALFVSIGAWSISHNGTVAGAYVQREVFANYLNKDYDFYSNTFFGALGAQAARLRDATTEYGRLVTLDIPRQVVVIVASVVVLAFQAPLLAIITLLCMVFILSYTIISSTWRLRYRRKLSEVSSEVAGLLGDSLTHNSTVKSFAAETYEQKRLEPTLAAWVNAQFSSWVSSIPSDVGRNVMAAITMGIMLIVTARMYERNQISIAIVALVQFYVIRLINITYDIAETIKNYETVMGSAYQPVSTMMVKPTVIDKDNTMPFPKYSDSLKITFDKVTYQYDEAAKNTFAVNKFSLQIDKGEKVGLVGYSGSGKTTLTKLLLRFTDVTLGEIAINGVDIRDLAQADLRRSIAYVPQEPLLFHRTIGDNINYGNPDATEKMVVNAARAANVEEFVEELPDKYKTFVGERGVKLSGGQRQRVAIARAILKDSPILILDEATSALDSESEKLIQDALWKLMQNRTALVIAHRLSTIQRMDKIVVMDKGKIVQIGTHHELLENPNSIYSKLWAHQSGGYIVEDIQLT